MKCYFCGAPLDSSDSCPKCGARVRVWKKIAGISNALYNDGLQKARVRDLSGAVMSLKMSLRYNKKNIEARNLLGLVYYEMGETVSAMSEWVASKSMAPEENPASGYIMYLQKSSARMEAIDQTAKKYNQSVNYCRQGSYDLAVIQLKKVISLNPKLLKAHQLLALLYMRDARYDLASRSLNRAESIDAKNTVTMRYRKECEDHLRASGKPGKQKEEAVAVAYESSNDTVIHPLKLTDHAQARTVANLLIGLAIGVAVVSFLVIPGVRQRGNTRISAQTVEADQELAAKEEVIQSMEDELEDMRQQTSQMQSESDSVSERIASYQGLLDACMTYADGDYEEAGEALGDVDRSLLEEDGQDIYDDISENGSVAYYTAFAYYEDEDYANALKWFYVAAENAGSKMAATAEDMIDELEEEGYE